MSLLKKHPSRQDILIGEIRKLDRHSHLHIPGCIPSSSLLCCCTQRMILGRFLYHLHIKKIDSQAQLPLANYDTCVTFKLGANVSDTRVVQQTCLVSDQSKLYNNGTVGLVCNSNGVGIKHSQYCQQVDRCVESH